MIISHSMLHSLGTKTVLLNNVPINNRRHVKSDKREYGANRTTAPPSNYLTTLTPRYTVIHSQTGMSSHSSTVSGVSSVEPVMPDFNLKKKTI
jgi:hypothetical protein